MKIEADQLYVGTKDIITSVEPIAIMDRQEHERWRNEAFTFLGERGQYADGCIFTIDPVVSSEDERNAIFVVRSLTDTTFQEAIVEGSGYWLAQSPEGEVMAIELNKEDAGTVVEWGGSGWVKTWIAKETGAKIIDITTPKFAPGETEEQVPIDDPSVSAEFWETYHALRMVIDQAIVTDSSQLQENKVLSQKEGLKRLYAFVNNKIDFSAVRSFKLNLSGRNLNRQKPQQFPYYLGKTGETNEYFVVILPNNITDIRDSIYVKPNIENLKGETPYYWIDLYRNEEESQNSDTLPLSSFYLDTRNNKIDGRHWHSLGERLIVDYLDDTNGIIFEDLIAFKRTVGKKESFVPILSGNTDYMLNLAENPYIDESDILEFIPSRDDQRFYQWLDIVKVDSTKPRDQWTVIASYRLFPEEHRLSSVGWFGVEKQLLLEYLSGDPKVKFKNLRSIRAKIPPRANALDLFQVKGSDQTNRISATFYFPDNSFVEGEEVIIIPVQDDQERYQWLDVYKNDPKTHSPLGKPVVSARIINGKITTKEWLGYERQLLKDYSEGKVKFDELKPISLTAGKSKSMLNLWKREGKKVYIVLSQHFNLKEGDSIIFLPEEEIEGEQIFLLIKGDERLARYKFDFEKKQFVLVNNLVVNKGLTPTIRETTAISLAEQSFIQLLHQYQEALRSGRRISFEEFKQELNDQ